MANRYAVATGNWSNTATWNGGTLPQAGDVVRPNAFTVTIDQDINVESLRNDASSPAVAGGAFVITSATTRTLNCHLKSIGAGGSTGSGLLLRLQSTGIVNIIGNITQTGNPVGSLVAGLSIEANSTVNHTGNATGGDNNLGYAIPCVAIRISSVCIFNGVGNYIGGTGHDGYFGTYAIILIGISVGIPTINITGGLYSGTAMGSAAVGFYVSNGSLNIVGIVQSSNTSPAIYSFTSQYYPGANNPIYVSGNIINVAGINAISAGALKISSISNVTWLMQTENALVNKTLYSANALTGFPVEADVADGTIYGPTSEFEGTLLPWDPVFTQALATDLNNLLSPSILAAITP
jgi:hypothetical protein